MPNGVLGFGVLGCSGWMAAERIVWGRLAVKRVGRVLVVLGAIYMNEQFAHLRLTKALFLIIDFFNILIVFQLFIYRTTMEKSPQIIQ